MKAIKKLEDHINVLKKTIIMRLLIEPNVERLSEIIGNINKIIKTLDTNLTMMQTIMASGYKAGISDDKELFNILDSIKFGTMKENIMKLLNQLKDEGNKLIDTLTLMRNIAEKIDEHKVVVLEKYINTTDKCITLINNLAQDFNKAFDSFTEPIGFIGYIKSYIDEAIRKYCKYYYKYIIIKTFERYVDLKFLTDLVALRTLYTRYILLQWVVDGIIKNNISKELIKKELINTLWEKCHYTLIDVLKTIKMPGKEESIFSILAKETSINEIYNSIKNSRLEKLRHELEVIIQDVLNKMQCDKNKFIESLNCLIAIDSYCEQIIPDNLRSILNNVDRTITTYIFKIKELYEKLNTLKQIITLWDIPPKEDVSKEDIAIRVKKRLISLFLG